MPRRRGVPKRETMPDAKYGDISVSRFINAIMRMGKKSVAERITYGAFDIIEKKGADQALKVFKQALANVRPVVEVKSRRVGGATYQVPVEVGPDRRLTLSMRWLLAAARARPGKSMAEKLAGELIDAANNSGAAIKKREETHRMAEANRAFAHYRW